MEQPADVPVVAPGDIAQLIWAKEYLYGELIVWVRWLRPEDETVPGFQVVEDFAAFVIKEPGDREAVQQIGLAVP